LIPVTRISTTALVWRDPGGWFAIADWTAADLASRNDILEVQVQEIDHDRHRVGLPDSLLARMNARSGRSTHLLLLDHLEGH
jgi:hypothetical protein